MFYSLTAIIFSLNFSLNTVYNFVLLVVTALYLCWKKPNIDVAAQWKMQNNTASRSHSTAFCLYWFICLICCLWTCTTSTVLSRMFCMWNRFLRFDKQWCYAIELVRGFFEMYGNFKIEMFGSASINSKILLKLIFGRIQQKRFHFFCLENALDVHYCSDKQCRLWRSEMLCRCMRKETTVLML